MLEQDIFDVKSVIGCQKYFRGCLKSLICNPKVCRGVAFGQEFFVYFRVYLYALTGDICYCSNTLSNLTVL
jgi:hypothetical protein